jgi:hypothetical protein
MPVNIPYDKPVSQDLYAGTSEQQVDALTDLLMHFDAFAKRSLSLEAYLRQQPAPQQGQQPAASVSPGEQPVPDTTPAERRVPPQASASRGPSTALN